jgi:V8-like Glu-specific endopeptidase
LGRWKTRSIFAVAALLAVATVTPTTASDATPVNLTARQFTGTSSVGALFPPSSQLHHSCTASVVSSLPGDVLVTAAHCVSRTGIGYVFAPGFHDGISPYLRWKVTRAYLDPAWLCCQDPERDFAFLTVAPQLIGGRYEQIEQVTGANRLGFWAFSGERVRVPAYPAGTDNDPITCTARLYFHGPYPAFDCDPYVTGTSGSPFLIHTARGAKVVGVIGGVHQGGCTSSTSYSSPFGEAAKRAYLRAASGTPGDSAPSPGPDGC